MKPLLLLTPPVQHNHYPHSTYSKHQLSHKTPPRQLLFNKALKTAIRNLKTGFPFASIRLEIGHTTDLPAAVADRASLLYALLAQPWESVVFNVNRVSNFFLQKGYDYDAVVRALADLAKFLSSDQGRRLQHQKAMDENEEDHGVCTFDEDEEDRSSARGPMKRSRRDDDQVSPSQRRRLNKPHVSSPLTFPRTFQRHFVSVGTDGFAVFALQDSQMYWEGLRIAPEIMMASSGGGAIRDRGFSSTSTASGSDADGDHPAANVVMSMTTSTTTTTTVQSGQEDIFQ